METLTPLSFEDKTLPAKEWAAILAAFDGTVITMRELAAAPASERTASKDLIIGTVQELLMNVARACPDLNVAQQICNAIDYALLPEPSDL
jgi:hypothetical protein